MGIVSVVELALRRPTVTTDQMLAHLIPPRQFSLASLDNYIPNNDFPSQAEARDATAAFFARGNSGLFRKADTGKGGMYLDGGFGVGKTHLLAAAWHLAKGRKYFGTFIEYTALVGALGYATAVAALKGTSFIAIDEFELDDPGDTMLMTRLLGELMTTGTRVMATSNTPPNALGEGRFAAADFIREIHALSDRFVTLRIDGVDYRHRENEGKAVVSTADVIDELCAESPGVIARDDFMTLISVLGQTHPSAFHALINDVDVVVWSGVTMLTDQNDALRLVALVDRLYDADVPIRAVGIALDQVFSPEMLDGGFRKKYLRAQSRLVALTNRPIGNLADAS